MPKADVAEKILPSEPCVFCAEKHFHTARRLVEEYGYTAVNRGNAIGELVLCQWHLWKTGNDALCEMVRAARHLIQQRREAEVDWHPLLTAIDWLASQEASKDLEETKTDKKEA